VTHGVHIRTSEADDDAARLRAWQYALPFWSSFTSLTAAALRGWWLPPLPAGLPIFVASGRASRIARPGLRVCRHDTLPPWMLVEGVRVAHPAETVLACARDLALLDVVLIGDGALHRGDVTPAELTAVSRLRRRGGPLLRRAIPLMDPRAESIFESLLRLLHVVCDVEVEPQHLVVDSTGGVVARADLLLVGTSMLHEVDGGHHLTRPQQRKDLSRHRRILTAGYERRGYTSRDVLTSPIGVLRDSDSVLGRVHDASRLTPWYALLQDSLFTASGQHRLECRLGIGAENAEERQ
jgi:very-short-patch-repair endonuclease